MVALNMSVLAFVLLFCFAFVVAEEPVHVHLAYGALDTQMQVTFASSSACGASYVLYSLVGSSASQNTSAVKSRFSEGNDLGKQYVYNALLEDLVQGQKYNYICVCDNDKSGVFQFTAKPSGNNWAANLLIFGDMGRTLGPQALPALIDEVKSGWPNTAIHVGDFAYDMDSAGGINGDIFMNQIQDVADIPYMVAVGNHEANNNFSQYINRFTMPGTNDNQFPAFTLEAQLEFLEQDLIEANSHRDIPFFVIVYTRDSLIPAYMSPHGSSHTDTDPSIALTAMMNAKRFTIFRFYAILTAVQNVSKPRKAFEDLFHKYGGHEHSYERLWPVYNSTVTQQNYDSPKASVHIITGCAGCNENLGVCVNEITGSGGPWSAFRASGKAIYGYGRLQVFNSTHAYWEEVEAESKTVLDSVWITQQSHGPFNEL